MEMKGMVKMEMKKQLFDEAVQLLVTEDRMNEVKALLTRQGGKALTVSQLVRAYKVYQDGALYSLTDLIMYQSCPHRIDIDTWTSLSVDEKIEEIEVEFTRDSELNPGGQRGAYKHLNSNKASNNAKYQKMLETRKEIRKGL